MQDKIIDCRSEEGTTIGLIDSLISISRVLSERLRKINVYEKQQILEALKDFTSDKDVKYICGLYEGSDIAPMSKEEKENRKWTQGIISKMRKDNIKIEI